METEQENSQTGAKENASQEKIYAVGSVSKVYVTTAVMQLSEEGKVNLDAPVTEYIPDFKMADERYKEITVRGIGERIGYSTGVIYYHFKDKQDIMDSVDRLLDEETYNTVFSLVDPERSIKENLSALFDYTCDLAYNNVEAYKRVFTTSRIQGNDYTRKMWLNMFAKRKILCVHMQLLYGLTNLRSMKKP